GEQQVLDVRAGPERARAGVLDRVVDAVGAALLGAVVPDVRERGGCIEFDQRGLEAGQVALDEGEALLDRLALLFMIGARAAAPAGAGEILEPFVRRGRMQGQR